MKRILIFGNSGSGKSTLAQALSQRHALAHLDLDTLAWAPTNPPTRKALPVSQQAIEEFMRANDSWVIEGCYADLLACALSMANELIYLNLPVATCIDNAKKRPWEAHKYVSKEEQDANLAMLIDWIREYSKRADEFSKFSHQALYDNYNGEKHQYTSNVDLNALSG